MNPLSPPIGADAVVHSISVESAVRALRRSSKPEAAAILRRLDYLQQRLLLDCQDGDVIPCPLPRKAKRLEERHGRPGNLYCCDLPGFWRLLYTIARFEGRRYVVVLEVVPHAKHDEWF